MKLRAISIEDLSVLQELAVKQTEAVPGQVRVLEMGVQTESGPVVLGVDREGRLVVLVMSVFQEEGLLSQLIGIYGWISRNMSLLTRFYAKQGLNSTGAPRIIAIAPGFPQTVMDGLTYLTFTIELYQYRGLEINGERGLLLEPIGEQVPGPEPEKPIKPDAVEDLLKGTELTDEEVRFFQESYPSTPAA